MRLRAAILAAGAAAVLLHASVGFAASDELRSRQWGIAKIHAPRAWTETQGAGIIVGVIDTGVDGSHEDLAGRVLPGRDFVDDDADASDEHGHGTLVAGIIAARRGNGAGGVGVAPRARILPVRALDEEGRGEPEQVAAAIRWTVERGAAVINLSLTVDQDTSTLFGGLFADRRVEQAIDDAADAGVLVLIASGNDPSGGQDETAYDATRPEVLVVGASTIDDRLAAYSNHGAGLDLVAPGGGNATQPARRGCNDGNWIISTWWTASGSSPYGATCGTSMATAFASGVGALLRAQGYDAAGAADRMRATARDLGDPGRDDRFGAGRIDAAAAVGAEAASPRPTPTGTRTPDASPAATSSSRPQPSNSPSMVISLVPTQPPDAPAEAAPPASEETEPAAARATAILVGAVALATLLAARIGMRRVRATALRREEPSETDGA